MKRGTFILLAVVCLRGGVANAERTEQSCREMMQANAYQGTWKETVALESLSLSFATNGTGILNYRGNELMFGWASNGRGKIDYELQLGGPSTFDGSLRYDPKSDTMRMDLKRDKVGFKGVLKFLSRNIPVSLYPPEEVVTVSQKKRLQKLLQIGDERVKVMASAEAFPDFAEIEKRNLRWGTIDDEYPRILIERHVVVTNFIDMTIVFGYHEKFRGKSVRNAVGGRARPAQPGDGRMDNPEGAKAMRRFSELCQEYWLEQSRYCIEYGFGVSAWQEESTQLLVTKSEFKQFTACLKEFLTECSKFPRYYAVEEKRNEER